MLLPCRRRRPIVFGAKPFGPDPRFPPQDHGKLTGVMLRMPQIVEEKFADVELIPPESTSLQRSIVR